MQTIYSAIRHRSNILLPAVIFFTQAAAAQQLYRITNLGDLPGNFGPRVAALNESGQVVGFSFSSPNNDAFIWDAVNGMQDLGDFTGAQGVNATDINDAGLVTGWTEGGVTTSFTWDGAYQDLGVVTGFHQSVARAINNSNQVVGELYSGPFGFEWDDDGSGMAQLTDSIGGVDLRGAADISDTGTVVGMSGDGEAFVLVPGAAAIELGLLSPGDVSSHAFGVNASDQVVGESRSGSSTARAFFWQPGGSMMDMGSTEPAHDLIGATAINDAGVAVGYSSGLTTSDAFVWTLADGIQDLNDLIDPADPLAGAAILQQAYDINNAGQIVVDGTLNFFPAAFLLTPVTGGDPPERVVFEFSGPLISVDDVTGTGTYAGSVLGDDMSGRFIVGANSDGSSFVAPWTYEFPSNNYYGRISDGMTLTSTMGSLRDLEVSFENDIAADMDAIELINEILGTNLPVGTLFDALQIETDITSGSRRLEIGVSIVSLDLSFITDASYFSPPPLAQVDFAVYFIVEEDGPATLYEAIGLITGQSIYSTLLDTDADGVPDFEDNCTLVANGAQRDSDGDGYGNFCDPDLNGDFIVNAIDLGLFKTVFFSADADADFNGDGVVNVLDLGILKAFFFMPPGPSGVAP